MVVEDVEREEVRPNEECEVGRDDDELAAAKEPRDGRSARLIATAK